MKPNKRHKKRRSAKARNTLQKRLLKLETPKERLSLVVAETDAPKVQRAAEIFVDAWKTMHALMELDEKCGGDSRETDAAIDSAWGQSRELLSTAIGKWDATFFEDVAKAMRYAGSALNKRLWLVDVALIHGLSPSYVAKELTKNCPDSYESELRQVRREFQKRRGDK